MTPQSEKSPPSSTPHQTFGEQETAASESIPVAADYVYRIAAVTAGIFFLATVV